MDHRTWAPGETGGKVGGTEACRGGSAAADLGPGSRCAVRRSPDRDRTARRRSSDRTSRPADHQRPRAPSRRSTISKVGYFRPRRPEWPTAILATETIGNSTNSTRRPRRAENTLHRSTRAPVRFGSNHLSYMSGKRRTLDKGSRPGQDDVMLGPHQPAVGRLPSRSTGPPECFTQYR